MSMQNKTLGGDRLGSGNKMKVHLHNYERSTHDIGYVWRSTMAAGTLVPFMDEVALPGTTFDINLGCDVKTHPTIGPLFGSYKVQLDVFLVPIRLYNSKLHNNALNVGRNMSTIKLPQIELTSTFFPIAEVEDLDNAQINPSSLLAYLGIRGIGRNTDEETPVTREFNAVSILAYWEIYKNYYANKQEEIGAVIHTPVVANTETVDTIEVGTTLIPESPTLGVVPLTTGQVIQISFTGTQPLPSEIMVTYTPTNTKSLQEIAQGWTLVSAGVLEATYQGIWGNITLKNWRYRQITDIGTSEPNVVTFPLVNLDTMREDILATNGTTVFTIDSTSIAPYGYLATPNNLVYTQEGLAVKTYQSDLFNNWLKTENIEAISTATAVDTSSGSFTIDALIISKKVWQMLNRINVSGGSYDDWQDAVYMHERFKTLETPMYMGGLIKELVFQEVVSNTQTEEQPLGTLAGKGVMAGKHKGGNIIIRVDEPSMVIGIASLTPRIDYSQGNKWHVYLKTMDDFHKPALDEIGFQDLMIYQMAWWTDIWNGATWTQPSAGKQPAWLNYMTNVNKTYGNFAIANNEMFMTLNRRYESDEVSIGDLTTYIDPAKFNFIFAETSIDAQNFWVQIGVDITARRKMSGKLMPNL